MALNFVLHNPAYGDKDLEGTKQFFAAVCANYLDAQFTSDDLMAAEGEKVVARVTFRGTDTGGSIALGMPPTGTRSS